MTARRQTQRGIALLLILLVALAMGASMALSFGNSANKPQDLDQRTQQALRQAKEAIIAWSVSHDSQPGRLPCPEETNSIGTGQDGTADSSCSNSTIHTGRIAWRTLGLDHPEDGAGERLWYVLSPGFRGIPSAGASGVANDQLSLDGIPNSAAALIISPGAPLAGQARSAPSPADPPQASDYLDMGNAVGSVYVSTGPKGTFNDQVLAITSQELRRAMMPRVLAEIRGAFGLQNGLRRYYNDNGQFPPAGTAFSSLLFNTQTRNWLSPASNTNLWFSLVTYTYLSPTSVRLSAGGITLNVSPCAAIPCP